MESDFIVFEVSKMTAYPLLKNISEENQVF